MKGSFALWLLCFALRAWASSDVQPMLINGTPADPKDWPASVYAAMGNARCTATVVGERVLLIAAHCVEDSPRATFSVGPNNYQGSCSYPSQYPSNATADWALCVVNKTVTGIPYEVVNQDPNLLKVGDTITLTGYGCVSPGGGGGNDGTYRVGTSKIAQVPSGGSDNDIVTKNGAALCYGDSGGPAFYGSGDARKLISVNSRGNISTDSYLVSTATDMARTFISGWASKNGVKICGVNADAVGCRGGSGPANPTEFTLQSRSLTLTGKMKNGYESQRDRLSFFIGQALSDLDTAEE